MVNLTHEVSFLQKIEELATNPMIQGAVKVTTQKVKSSIEKLVRINRQRFNAAKFYLNLIEKMDTDFYLGIQVISSTELKFEWSSVSKPLANFTDNNFHVEINLLNNNTDLLPENCALIVFILVNGFFSNLISLEDCIAQIINIVYDLIPTEDRPSFIRKELNNKMQNRNLISHLRVFHAIDQNGKSDKKGSTFNIAREIRNQLTHNDIDGVVVSLSPISLSGPSSASELHFHNSFFPPNTEPADTKMIAFCQNSYDETVNFVNECYKLIYADLQQSGVLPIL